MRNQSVYLKTQTDLSSTYKDKIIKVVTKMFKEKQISEKMFSYLIEDGNHTSIFYLLPKTHKNIYPPPARPIVSSINSPTEKISQMIDLILQPYAKNGKSFKQDTSDFIQKVQQIVINDDDWIFTMDVTSLYTNIPHTEGISIVRETIKDRVDLPKNEYIIQLLNLVLKCNCFRFLPTN